MVAIPTAAAKHRPDVAVDRFNLAERHLDVTVGQDAVEVTTEQLGDLVESRQPLPPQGTDPGGQKSPRRAFVRVVPEVGELLLEQMRFGEAAIEGEQFPKLMALIPLEVAPGPEQQPPLAA